MADNNEKKDNLDINQHIGSFLANDNVDKSTIKELTKLEEEQDRLEKQIETIEVKEEKLLGDNEDAKIDFDKFNRTKKQKKSTTRLGIKLDIWLRNPKTLLRIWLIALAVIVVLLGSQIFYLVEITGILKHISSGLIKQNALGFKTISSTANVFSYIGVFILVIPFFWLLVSVVVGINGTASSRTFHYALWLCIIISIVCWIISSIMSIYSMVEIWTFQQPS